MSDEKWKLKNAKCGQPLRAHGMRETIGWVHFKFFILQYSFIIQTPEPARVLPKLSTLEIRNLLRDKP
jgi:hypothetical protein